MPNRLGSLTPKRVRFTNLFSTGSAHSFHYHKITTNHIHYLENTQCRADWEASLQKKFGLPIYSAPGVFTVFTTTNVQWMVLLRKTPRAEQIGKPHSKKSSVYQSTRHRECSQISLPQMYSEWFYLEKHPGLNRLGSLTPKRVRFTDLSSTGSVHSFHYHKCTVNGFT